MSVLLRSHFQMRLCLCSGVNRRWDVVLQRLSLLSHILLVTTCIVTGKLLSDNIDLLIHLSNLGFQFLQLVVKEFNVSLVFHDVLLRVWSDSSRLRPGSFGVGHFDKLLSSVISFFDHLPHKMLLHLETVNFVDQVHVIFQNPLVLLLVVFRVCLNFLFECFHTIFEYFPCLSKLSHRVFLNTLLPLIQDPFLVQSNHAKLEFLISS